MVGAKQLFNEAGNDVELKEMARAEIKDLEAQQGEIEARLVVLMLPQVSFEMISIIVPIYRAEPWSSVPLGYPLQHRILWMIEM